jgi:hypothetical protein
MGNQKKYLYDVQICILKLLWMIKNSKCLNFTLFCASFFEKCFLGNHNMHANI